MTHKACLVRALRQYHRRRGEGEGGQCLPAEDGGDDDHDDHDDDHAAQNMRKVDFRVVRRKGDLSSTYYVLQYKAWVRRSIFLALGRVCICAIYVIYLLLWDGR